MICIVSAVSGALLALPALFALGLVSQSPRAAICAAMGLSALAAALPLSWGIPLGLFAFGLLLRGLDARSADPAIKADGAASVGLARRLNDIERGHETIEEEWLRENYYQPPALARRLSRGDAARLVNLNLERHIASALPYPKASGFDPRYPCCDVSPFIQRPRDPMMPLRDIADAVAMPCDRDGLRVALVCWLKS